MTRSPRDNAGEAGALQDDLEQQAGAVWSSTLEHVGQVSAQDRAGELTAGVERDDPSGRPPADTGEVVTDHGLGQVEQVSR
jgi:hypothetical protein